MCLGGWWGSQCLGSAFLGYSLSYHPVLAEGEGLGGFSQEAGGELRLGEAGGTGWAKRIWAVHKLGLGRESPR